MRAPTALAALAALALAGGGYLYWNSQMAARVPTTGIDPLSRRQFWTLIDEIKSERPEMTVLVSTAYMEDEAERFGRLVAFDAGRVLADGATTDTLARTGADSLERPI